VKPSLTFYSAPAGGGEFLKVLTRSSVKSLRCPRRGRENVKITLEMTRKEGRWIVNVKPDGF